MADHLIPLRFRLNGQDCEAEVKSHELLIDFIRDRLGLTGTKRSCEIEICGVCTVLLNGKAVSACAMFAFEVDGKDIMTIEGLSQGQKLHPLQQAFIERGGFQCGFCTPGMVLTAVDLLARVPDPSEAEIRQALAGNLCMCTGYENIVRAVRWAAAHARAAHA